MSASSLPTFLPCGRFCLSVVDQQVSSVRKSRRQDSVEDMRICFSFFLQLSAGCRGKLVLGRLERHGGFPMLSSHEELQD